MVKLKHCSCCIVLHTLLNLTSRLTHFVAVLGSRFVWGGWVHHADDAVQRRFAEGGTHAGLYWRVVQVVYQPGERGGKVWGWGVMILWGGKIYSGVWYREVWEGSTFVGFVFNSPGIAVMTLIIVLLSDLLMKQSHATFVWAVLVRMVHTSGKDLNCISHAL